MNAKTSFSGTETFEPAREHRSFRLDARLLAVIEDLAKGVESGESGLKSCALGATSAASLGATAAEVSATHHRELAVVEDEDQCFDEIGSLLAAGYTHKEIQDLVTLGGGSTHLLALERWCDLVRLGCDRDQEMPTRFAGRSWRGKALHERRRRGRRAMAALRDVRGGAEHVAVLHVVYGWPDPFVGAMAADVRVELGPEFAPLARYTDAVEAKRVAMVRAAVAQGARKTPYVRASDRPLAIHAHEPQVSGLSAAIAQMGETLEVFRLAASHGLKTEGKAETASGVQLFDLERARSLRQWHDRNLTSGDALRAGVAPPRGRHPDESKEDYREHVAEPAMDARDAFLTAVKLDANRMLTEASLAFQDAWLAS